MLVGYILAGLIFGAILPSGVKDVARLSEIGTILLLFSIGVELSFSRLSKFLKVAITGSLIQIILVASILYFILTIFGFSPLASLILASGFSLSSTVIVVKILGDRGEMDTIHGGIMFAWLLVQDLAVIPIMVILPILGKPEATLLLPVLWALSKAFFIVFIAVVLGRLIVPFLIHKIASANSRELLTLSSVALALGTAVATTFFGIGPALGAFLAGVVISESQENHAVFAETRPLRDLFVALFFVSLGFLISPGIIFSRLGLIVLLAVLVMTLKAFIVFFLSTVLGFRGRTAIANAFGLAQVGEFSFVIFSSALTLGLVNQEVGSLGIAVTLVTLIFAPILFNITVPAWRKLKKISSIFSSLEKNISSDVGLTGHIIICGYGRVGSWIGKVLTDFKIPFAVIEYNQTVVGNLKAMGIPVIYGDPGEPEVLESLNIQNAKALILAIPDRVAQENLIAYVQTYAPNVKIISRVHQDEDFIKLKAMRVDRIVQPEFEAAVAIVRGILTSMGKSKEEISKSIKSLRFLHSK